MIETGVGPFVSPAGSAPNTILCAISRRHSFNRRCNVRRCPSGKAPGCSCCSRSNNSRDVRHGSASNHSRTRAVTVTNGSGRRRPRCAFGLLVGRTSPSCHAVRNPEKNWSSVGVVNTVVSSATGRSAPHEFFVTIELDQESRRWPSPGNAPPRWSAYPLAAADRASPGENISS